jgi:hypothetical protein
MSFCRDLGSHAAAHTPFPAAIGGYPLADFSKSLVDRPS